MPAQYITLSSRSATALFDAINSYQTVGYQIQKVWYEFGLFWTTWYYAKLYKPDPIPPKPPYLEFIIGPITNKEMPKPPPLPHIEFIIGPITNREMPKPPELPHLEFVIGPVKAKNQ